MTQNKNHRYIPQEEEINLRKLATAYLREWRLFIAGVVLCLLAAFLYLRYTTPVYHTKATIIIKDEDKGAVPSEISAFADLGLLGGMGAGSIENEIGILRSERLMTNVVKELDLNIRYFREGAVRTTELFEDSPIKVQLLSFDEEAFSRIEEPGSLFFHITSDATYTIEIAETEFREKKNFGEALQLPYAEILVTPNLKKFSELNESPENRIVEVTLSTVEGTAIDYQLKLQANLTDKNSSLIELGLADPVRSKARQILDELIAQYNEQAIADKNLVSLNTASFIEDRLQIISRELDSVETGKEQFKKENELTNIEEESRVFIENASEFQNRLLEVETQLELANTMLEYLNSDEEGGLLPSNLGFKEEGVGMAIKSYNELVLERERILSGSTELNPLIVSLNNQIRQVRANVLQSLNNLRTSLRIALNDLEMQEKKMGVIRAQVPAKEKQFRNIERQQNIKEALYLYLLQKREETSLALAVTAPKAKIVDSARSSLDPVSPKPKIIYLAGLILGLLIPFLYIYIRNMWNNKVLNRNDIEEVTGEIPIIGEIPRIDKNTEELIRENDRSVLAESFRILHNNLQYMLRSTKKNNRGRSIIISSSIKGEGKTFTAFNLAVTLANSGKKTLIVGGDLRNPQLQKYEPGSRSFLGVSDYLVNDDLKLDNLIKRSSIHPNLDLLASGSIPPNPSELLGQEKAKLMIEALEASYDYVIIDTAPSMLVVDTFLINEYADLTLYVVRAGYTEKELLTFPVDARNDNKIGKVGFVLNDVEAAQFGYGNKYGYSYAYGEDKPGFWESFRNKAALW